MKKMKWNGITIDMKKKKMKGITKVGILLTAAALIFTGCGSAASTGQEQGAENTAKTKIVIATGGMPKPFSYVNPNNELEGYDIDVVKAIFKELPQYEIALEKTEFPSIFAGLDSDRYQVGANNFAMNKERQEKYIYTKPIFKNQFVIAVAEDRSDINSFTDLEGKSTEVQPGINYTTALEKYNQDHQDKPVVLNYSEAEMISVLQRVESGTYDFQLIDAPMLKVYIEEYGLKLKSIPLTEEESDLIGNPYSYLLVSRGSNGEKLAADINGALKKLIDDGTVSKISEKYFGQDLAPETE